ncbi:ParM/StbA family protein [Acetatifactor muris]|uniref:ParM/StbA family protein n=1 Tax=Acetatifactor muris TaxID=879566 RepID=UPI0023F34C55|nr:ParM/StbA family protein [Acetatifactor muris]
MNKHIEVIGIDHGWSNMKTVSQIFTTGVKEITTEPAFFDNIVEWDGTYYKVGGKRLEVRDTKVENDNFYLLTLAAVAKELNRRGMRNSNILLSVGLPLTRFGAEKQDFIKYLARNKDVIFRFEKEKYHIRIARVSVFPQCYAAVADCIRTLPERAVIVDIGSWTIDIMPIRKYYPDESECTTIPQGLIRCMREINEECVRKIGQEIDENLIQEVMAGGRGTVPEKYMEIIEGCLKGFVEKVYNTLKEHGYNLDITPIIFVGGGAAVMKLYGNNAGINIQYIPDVKANAKGYEYLGRAYLANNRKTVEAEAE